MICMDYEKGKLTWNEAFKNLTEVFNEEDPHIIKVWEKLLKDQMESMGYAWHGNGD